LLESEALGVAREFRFGAAAAYASESAFSKAVICPAWRATSCSRWRAWPLIASYRFCALSTASRH